MFRIFPTAASGLLRERQGETVSWSKAKLNMNLDGAKTMENADSKNGGHVRSERLKDGCNWVAKLGFHAA